MIVKRILCLANSRKLSGRCIAGCEVTKAHFGEWVRPVSAREHQEVSERERKYEDGSDPQVLDVIDIPLIKHDPTEYQQENWLLEPKHYWVKVRVATVRELDAFLAPLDTLWIDGHSTYNGVNDQVPLEAAKNLDNSLRLIEVNLLTLSVFPSGYQTQKRRVQGRFVHGRETYALWVTDPRYEREYLAQSDGEYELGPCYVTISLGEAFQGHCYKLVAAIIPK